MLRVDEIIDRLDEAGFVSKLDLNKWFHQVPLKQADIPEISFLYPGASMSVHICPSVCATWQPDGYSLEGGRGGGRSMLDFSQVY